MINSGFVIRETHDGRIVKAADCCDGRRRLQYGAAKSEDGSVCVIADQSAYAARLLRSHGERRFAAVPATVLQSLRKAAVSSVGFAAVLERSARSEKTSAESGRHLCGGWKYG